MCDWCWNKGQVHTLNRLGVWLKPCGEPAQTVGEADMDRRSCKYEVCLKAKKPNEEMRGLVINTRDDLMK